MYKVDGTKRDYMKFCMASRSRLTGSKEKTKIHFRGLIYAILIQKCFRIKLSTLSNN